VYFWTHFELLLVVIAIEHATILQQLAPWLRLDGYYVITDVTGVPDILSRVRPVLTSLLPGAAVDRRVQELKPWVRTVVTLYIVTLVPVMAFFYALLAIGAPRFFVAAAHALHVQIANAAAAWDAHHAGSLALYCVQILGIALPVVGTAVVLGMLAWRVTRLLWRRARTRARGILVFAAGAAAAALVSAWWNGAESRPALERAGAAAGPAGARSHRSGHAAAAADPAQRAAAYWAAPSRGNSAALPPPFPHVRRAKHVTPTPESGVVGEPVVPPKTVYAPAETMNTTSTTETTTASSTTPTDTVGTTTTPTTTTTDTVPTTTTTTP
jgi:putative peptide zinc metalloprotease protein